MIRRIIFLSGLVLFSTFLLSQHYIELNYTVETGPERYQGLLDYLLPMDIEGYQHVLSVEHSPVPSELNSYDGNKSIHFSSKDLFKEVTLEIRTQVVLIRKNDLHSSLDTFSDLSKEEKSICLKPYNLSKKDQMKINKLSDKLKAVNDLETVRFFFNYLVENLEPTYDNSEFNSVSKSLKKKKGSFIDYASIMSALCRSAGIPTRIVVGRRFLIGSKVSNYAWTQIYLNKKGWVSFDPFSSDEHRKTTTFEKIGEHLVITTTDFEPRMNLDSWFQSGPKSRTLQRFSNHEWGFMYEALQNRSWEFLMEKDYDKAIKVADSLVILMPRLSYSYQRKADIYLRYKEFDLALQNIQLGIKLAYTPYEKKTMLVTLARYFALKGEKDEAIKTLRSALEILPTHYYNLKIGYDFDLLKDYPSFIDFMKEHPIEFPADQDWQLFEEMYRTR